MNRKRIQLKFLVKTLAGWPEEGKGSQTFTSMQREAEEIKTDLAADQPTDMQLLSAREEVNATRRR
eukprot:9145425-Heterocapsa_arctica.AAC.1